MEAGTAEHSDVAGSSTESQRISADAQDAPTDWSAVFARATSERSRALFLVAGLALVGWLVWAVGTDAVVVALRTLSWRIVPVALIPALVLKVTDAYGWRALLPSRRPSTPDLFRAIVAGQAVGTLIPAGPVGSDGVMMMLLRDRLPRRDAFASLIVAHTTSVASQGTFLLIGLLIAWRLGDGGSPLIHVMWWLVLLETIAIAGFVAVQLRGVAARLERVLARFGLSRIHLPAAALHVDASLSGFYRRHRRNVALAFTWHFLGWLVGAAEVGVILYFCGMAVSGASACVIEALGTGVSFATFFVPVQFGIDEGGTVAIFSALGLSPAAGLSLALVRRIREAVWVTIGVVFLTTARKSSRPEAAAERA